MRKRIPRKFRRINDIQFVYFPPKSSKSYDSCKFCTTALRIRHRNKIKKVFYKAWGSPAYKFSDAPIILNENWVTTLNMNNK